VGVEFVALGNFSAPPHGVDPAEVDLGVYNIGKPVAYPGAASAGDQPVSRGLPNPKDSSSSVSRPSAKPVAYPGAAPAGFHPWIQLTLKIHKKPSSSISSPQRQRARGCNHKEGCSGSRLLPDPREECN